MIITQEINLDTGQLNEFVLINAKQADDNSRYLKVTVTNNGAKVNVPLGSTVSIRVLKPDGTSCFNPGTVNDDGTVTVELTAQALAVAGNARADISISNNTELLSTLTFIIRVQPVPLGAEIVSSNEFLQLVETIGRAETVIENMDVIQWQTLLATKPYKTVMRQYFELHGASDLTDLTELCDKWYAIARLGWTGGTTFSRTLSSGAGAKIGSNAGLTCAPSTPTLAATDNYAELPPFACVDVNEYLDADGKHHITAIDGIAGDFKRYDKSKIVSVMQMAPWIRWSSDSDTYTIEITDEIGKPGFVPWIDAVDLDGETRTWVTHVKYGFGYTGTASEYTACAGLPMRTHDISHNGQIAPIRTYWGNNRYCGKTSADDAWVKLMCYIKYASLSPETVGLYGCVSYYNNTLHPSIAETAVKRVIVPSSYLSSLVVGSTVSLGSASYGSVSTEGSVFAYKKILSLESVTIEDTAYCAVNIDTDEPFDTTTDLFLTTMMWYTGSTDSVRGNDGAVVLNNKSVCKIQGIEWGYGCYETLGDTIEQYFEENGQNYAGYYICRDASKIVSGSAADHELMGRIACPASSSWNYIKKLFGTNNAPECMLPEDITGASSSTYTRDAYYVENASSGLREWLSFGYLYYGGFGGMSCVNGSAGLGYTDWGIGGRLSTTGNRGERAAL